MSKMQKILILNDDAYIGKRLRKLVIGLGYEATLTIHPTEAKKLFRKYKYTLVLCNYRISNSNGLKMLRFFKSLQPQVPVIILSEYADVKLAVRLIKQGAANYITTPFQPEEIKQAIRKVLDADKKKSVIPDFDLGTDFVVGESQQIEQVMEMLKVVAPTDLTVLIEGETGSGKEYIARAIHHKSNRRKKPFIAVDCGAIPKELANSELFGHIKGAFTGAIDDKKGVFEQAK